MFTFSLLPSSCDFKKFTLNGDGDLDLWFGSDSSLMGEMGVDGTLFCDKSEFVHNDDVQTCEANMAGKNQHKPFGILYTDYENLDVGYYCMELGPKWLPFNFATDTALIYSRNQTIDEDTLNKA